MASFSFLKKESPDSGGTLQLTVGNDSYVLGMPADGFTFGWKGLGGGGSTLGQRETLPLPPGEVVLLTYEVEEHSNRAKQGGKPRNGKLTLKAQSARQ
jgi:hypothetical protein